MTVRSCELGDVVEVLREDRLDDVLEKVRVDDALQIGAVCVLCGEHHLGDLDRLAALVAHRDLRLPVRAKVRQDVGPAHFGEPPRQLVGQRYGQRHEFRRLVAGEAEHHALISGALKVEDVVVVHVGADLESLGDALADVRRLLVDRHHHAAGLVVVAVQRVGVAHVLDRPPHDLGDVDVGLGRDLAGDERETGGDQGLAGHTAVGVVRQDGVENGVRDLIRQLVRMALGDRFRREQVVLAVHCTS